MKIFFILVISFSLSFIISQNSQLSANHIYIGEYYFQNHKTHWNLSITENSRSKFFIFICDETERQYTFNYRKCNDDIEEVVVCNSDDQDIKLKFINLEEIKTCDGSTKMCFSKVEFTQGTNDIDQGRIFCK